MLTVGSTGATRPIPSGFLGVSLEYNTVSAYEGTDAATANPVLAQLIRNLAPGQTPVLRIGGDSTDWAWWPIPGITPPRGLSLKLTPQWMQQASTLAQSARARLILGVNLEADNPRIAAAEANEMVSAIGRRYIAALEIGNEPMLYPTLPWYHTASGQKVFGRAPSYDLNDYTEEFTRFAKVLPAVPLAGPAIGHSWVPQLPSFIRTAPRLSIVTLHAYAINTLGAAFRGRNCSTAELSDPAHPTAAALLDPFASTGLTRGLAPDVLLAHSRGLSFRVDEMNAITCAGTPGVSDTFASALWVLNALFSMAQVGIDGVNIHTWRGSAGKLFAFSDTNGQWSASVRPEYYGLLLFADAAPAGARLLPTTQTYGASIEGWATLARDRRIRVLLINHSMTRSQRVVVHLPRPRGVAHVERLQAPSATATAGVTLGGQTFGPTTTTGTLSGPAVATPVVPSAGAYAVTVAPQSAALMTVASALP